MILLELMQVMRRALLQQVSEAERMLADPATGADARAFCTASRRGNLMIVRHIEAALKLDVS